MNFEHFIQLLGSAVNVSQQHDAWKAAEREIIELQNSDPTLFFSLVLQTIQGERNDPIPQLAAILLRRSFMKNAPPLSLYEKIYDVVLHAPYLNNVFVSQILFAMIDAQLKINDDTIFKKFMLLFDDKKQMMHALRTAETLFEEREFIVTHYAEENIARYELLFNKIVDLVKVPVPDCPKDLFRALYSAVQHAEYLQSDYNRRIGIEEALKLIDRGITFGYQILTACLGHIYEDLEPLMEKIIRGISLTNVGVNEIDERDWQDKLETLSNFWMELCKLELKRQLEREEFSKYEISAPVQYLGLLERHGEQVICTFLEFIEREEELDYIDFRFDCIQMIATEFDIEIPDRFNKNIPPNIVEQIFIDAQHNLTHKREMMTLDTAFSANDVDLRLPPHYLEKIFVDNHSSSAQENICAGAGEFLPMYSNHLQNLAFEIAKRQDDEGQYKAFAEILRLPFARNLQDLIIRTLTEHFEAEESWQNFELCCKYVTQLFRPSEDQLESFFHRSRDPELNSILHLIQVLSDDFVQNEQGTIYDRTIRTFFDEWTMDSTKYDVRFKDSFAILGSLGQKVGAKLAENIYRDIMSFLQANLMPAIASYFMFDAVACIVPPTGTSYLTHLEAFITLLEKRIQVSDDVMSECVLRSLTTVFQLFKKTSNEYLFVGQIKRILNAVQPVLDNDPSMETMRAYLTFIKELSALDQAAPMLRSANLHGLLKIASESQDRFLRHLAQSVTKQLSV